MCLGESGKPFRVRQPRAETWKERKNFRDMYIKLEENHCHGLCGITPHAISKALTGLCYQKREALGSYSYFSIIRTNQKS